MDQVQAANIVKIKEYCEATVNSFKKEVRTNYLRIEFKIEIQKNDNSLALVQILLDEAEKSRRQLCQQILSPALAKNFVIEPCKLGCFEIITLKMLYLIWQTVAQAEP